MISQKIVDAINEQINAEIYSAYLYYSMCAYAEDQGLPGVANWMKIQAQEELTHANKFFDYINERGGRVFLSAIDAVPTEFGTVCELFDAVLEHEQLITSKINNLMVIAVDEKDFAFQSFLKWFIDEQVEEEANVQTIIDKLKMVDGKGQGLFMMDKDFAARTFVDETAGE